MPAPPPCCAAGPTMGAAPRPRGRAERAPTPSVTPGGEHHRRMAPQTHERHRACREVYSRSAVAGRAGLCWRTYNGPTQTRWRPSSSRRRPQSVPGPTGKKIDEPTAIYSLLEEDLPRWADPSRVACGWSCDVSPSPDRGLAVAEGGPALDARGGCIRCRGPLHEMQPKEEDT
jgi:hypothetical protein